MNQETYFKYTYNIFILFKGINKRAKVMNKSSTKKN